MEVTEPASPDPGDSIPFPQIKPLKRKIYDQTTEETKTARMATNTKTITRPTVTTSNKFAPLQHLKEKEIQANPVSTKPNNSNNNNKKSMPTPLIMHGTFDNPETAKYWINIFNQNLKKGYTYKTTKENVIIHCRDNIEKANLSNLFTQMDQNHHTHRAPDEKTHAFVVRGLFQDPSLSEIKQDLADQGLEIVNIFKMKNTKFPLFLIITTKHITLKYLNNTIRHICHAKVNWELQHKKRLIIQCKNCQCWGHGATYCKAKPQCLKCAGMHKTIDCTKSRDLPAKCANCLGDHPANYVNCKAYTDKIEFINKNKNNKANITNKTNANLNLNSGKEFPKLPNTPNTQQIPTANATPIFNATTYQQNTRQTPAQSQTSDLNELIKQINLLNSQINVKNMIRALKDLNATLAQAGEDPQSRALAMVTFNWTSYGI